MSDSCVLPVLMYGMQTIAFTEKSDEQHKTTQRAIEKRLLGVSLRYTTKIKPKANAHST